MIRSMTGFGKAVGSAGNKIITVEIKSLNSKFLEMTLRLPSSYKEKDLELRNEISKEVERGKVEFIVTFESAPGQARNLFNREAIGQYASELNSICGEHGLPANDTLGVIMRLPNVLNADVQEADSKEWKVIESLTRKALKEFNDFRVREGKVMQVDFEKRVREIQAGLKKIEKAEPARMKMVRSRLIKGLEEAPEVMQVDKNRFEQELIYYIEKMDVTEEKVRLSSHLSFFLETIRSKDSNGKKLGFILQEIGREINTIGSKANDAQIQRTVVEMKDELEKMKEQTANVI